MVMGRMKKRSAKAAQGRLDSLQNWAMSTTFSAYFDLVTGMLGTDRVSGVINDYGGPTGV